MWTHGSVITNASKSVIVYMLGDCFGFLYLECWSVWINRGERPWGRQRKRGRREEGWGFLRRREINVAENWLHGELWGGQKVMHCWGGEFWDQQVKTAACCGVNTSSRIGISSPWHPRDTWDSRVAFTADTKWCLSWGKGWLCLKRGCLKVHCVTFYSN